MSWEDDLYEKEKAERVEIRLASVDYQEFVEAYARRVSRQFGHGCFDEVQRWITLFEQMDQSDPMTRFMLQMERDIFARLNPHAIYFERRTAPVVGAVEVTERSHTRRR